MLCFTTYFVRLPTNTLLDGFYTWLLWAPLHLQLLLPRELQPLPEVHPILLSGVHCVPSARSQQLLHWVQCGVHHPQLDEVCELPVYCRRTSCQPKGKPCCCGRHSHAKWVTATDLHQPAVKGLAGWTAGAAIIGILSRHTVAILTVRGFNRTRGKIVCFTMIV